ncbi:MAG: FUSC family protein [Streptosporangiaceae bacterium]
MKIPRPLINDPGLVSLKSAARAAIVMPAVFAFADKVIAQPQTALFAAFGSLAILVFASFTGSARSRLTAYLSLGVSGVILTALGTACSGNAWLAAGAMAVVGFLILFSGVINGYFAAGGTAAVLVFVVSVTVPAPASEIPWRLAGWCLAAGVGILAMMLIWPPRERATLRADVARGCLDLAAVADSVCGDQPAEAATLAAARKSISGLRGRLTATPHRPTGPTRPTAALAGLIDELGWLLQSLDVLAGSPVGELCVAENTAAIREVAAVLRGCAAELDGRPELSGRDQTGKQPVQRLERARETASQLLARRVAELPHIPDEQALQDQVDRGFRVHTISYTARQIAAYARAASPNPGAPPIEGLPDLAGMEAAARSAAADPGADPLTGEVLPSHRWNGWIRSRLTGAEGFTVTHADYRSVWFRNSVRGAVGLAIAVFIAQKSGLQHSFWVVLGTLSVLRSNALGTGRSVISALAGTAAGIVVGAAILIPLNGHSTVLWGILPVAVLLGAYAPRVISFAAGQAAFTVVILVLFNIIEPTGWKVGIVRIEDVAVGFAISLGVGLVFWPRGAAALLRQNLAAAYSRTADYVAAMVEQLSGLDGGANPSRAELAATTAIHRLDDSYSQYLAERSAQRVDPERVSRMVGGVAKVLRAGESLADLSALADGPPVLGQAGPGQNGPGQAGPGQAGPGQNGPGQPQGQDGNAPRTQLPVSPAGVPDNGSRKPCAENLEQNVLALRAWYVTLGDSLVNGTAVPPPEQRDPAARQRLLHCTREAISRGQPAVARNALLVLWASEHLDMLWRLEERLGRTQEPGPAAAGRPADAPVTASAE